VKLPIACPAFQQHDPQNTERRLPGLGYASFERFMAMCWRCCKTPPRLSPAGLCPSCKEELRAISPA